MSEALLPEIRSDALSGNTNPHIRLRFPVGTQRYRNFFDELGTEIRERSGDGPGVLTGVAALRLVTSIRAGEGVQHPDDGGAGMVSGATVLHERVFVTDSVPPLYRSHGSITLIGSFISRFQNPNLEAINDDDRVEILPALLILPDILDTSAENKSVTRSVWQIWRRMGRMGSASTGGRRRRKIPAMMASIVTDASMIAEFVAEQRALQPGAVSGSKASDKTA